MLRDSPSPMLLYAPDLTLLYVNAAYEKMTGRRADDLIGRKMFDAFPPKPGEDAASAVRAIEASVESMIATGEPVTIDQQQHDLVNGQGVYEQRYWSIVQWPVHEGDKVVALLQRAEDVTEQVRQRRLTDAVRQAAEDASGLSFFSYDPATDRFERTAAIEQMFGFAAGEAGEHAAQFFERVLPEDLTAVLAEVERAMAGGPGTSASFDYRVEVPGGSDLRYIRVRAGVERDPSDGVPKLFGAFIDMSDIEQSRARMQELSERNAALVVESNHRIKNSLAIASAMLSYQLRASEEPAVEQALKTAATRIMAISDVHGELFADEGVEWVDAGHLLERFVRSFERTIDIKTTGCRIDVTAQSVRLPSRYAVTIALMLNELLTNAIKYGMTQQQECEITVELSADDANAELVVQNVIAGRTFGQIISEGVGSELVHAFAGQLGGTLEAGEQENKYNVSFVFPLPDEEAVDIR
jgi:PAS domain S-box-containing protein